MRGTLASAGVQLAVSHSEVDNSGYDVILEARGILRHIQLKAMHKAARRRSVDVQMRLGHKPNGCVVLMIHDPQTLALETYRWFGRAPGERLPELGAKVTRHSKGNAQGVKAERPALREVPISQFTAVRDVGELVTRLFGPALNGS